jgi:hypothetical protein
MYKWMDTAILSSMWRDISSIIYRLSSVRLQFDRAAGGRQAEKQTVRERGRGKGKEKRERERERERESTKDDTERSRRDWRL